jgi:N-acetylglutamate synthase
MTNPEEPAFIARLEHATLQGWPPAHLQHIHGWHAAISEGVTGRANAVYPLSWDVGADLDAAITDVEAAYQAAGLPPMFKLTNLSLPSELDAALEARGYTILREGRVLVADAAYVAEVLAGENPAATQISDAPDDAWFDLAGEGRNRRPIFARMPTPAAYVTACLDDGPVGAVQGVIVGEWCLINALNTLPAARHKGVGRSLVHRLARWAQDGGARALFLQVLADNVPAMRLYAGCGFRKVYSYWYRVKAGSGQ